MNNVAPLHIAMSLCESCLELAIAEIVVLLDRQDNESLFTSNRDNCLTPVCSYLIDSRNPFCLQFVCRNNVFHSFLQIFIVL